MHERPFRERIEPRRDRVDVWSGFGPAVRRSLGAVGFGEWGPLRKIEDVREPGSGAAQCAKSWSAVVAMGSERHDRRLERRPTSASIGSARVAGGIEQARRRDRPGLFDGEPRARAPLRGVGEGPERSGSGGRIGVRLPPSGRGAVTDEEHRVRGARGRDVGEALPFGAIAASRVLERALVRWALVVLRPSFVDPPSS